MGLDWGTLGDLGASDPYTQIEEILLHKGALLKGWPWEQQYLDYLWEGKGDGEQGAEHSQRRATCLDLQDIIVLPVSHSLGWVTSTSFNCVMRVRIKPDVKKL